MGQVAAKICGGTGILDMLLKKYGPDVGKFIAIEKVKQFLDAKIAQLKNTVGGQSTNILNQVTGTIDGKKNQLTSTFHNYKQIINEKTGGRLADIQKLKGQSIESMLGYNDFVKKFDQLKHTASSKFTQQQQNVFQTIDRTAQQQKQVLNQQRPQLPIYDSLSPSQQKIVFAEGQKMFSKQIQQHQDTMMQQLGDKLNPEAYLGNFKNIIPMGSLDGILGNATSKFQQVKNLLAGGGLGSLGGIASSLGINL